MFYLVLFKKYQVLLPYISSELNSVEFIKENITCALKTNEVRVIAFHFIQVAYIFFLFLPQDQCPGMECYF